MNKSELIELSVIVPVYNEEDIIEKVIYDWLTVAKKFNGFLIIINDGSSDNSLKIKLLSDLIFFEFFSAK